MKGRTICPKCKHEFVLDVPNKQKKYEATCPKCKNKFTIQTTSCDPDKDKECYWEEHGEPRKTILSSIKPKTDKPMIVAILLVAVFALGITTAAFSETFIESSMGILSNTGVKGTVELFITNQSNSSLEDVNVIIGGIPVINKGEGLYVAENVTLGIQTVRLSLTNYKTLNREILVFPFISTYHEITMEEGDETKTIVFDVIGCSIIFAIFAVFALLGAMASLKRQHFDVAVAGSLIGIFSFGFFMVGSLISIAAFIVIMLCKDEFENGKQGKTF